MLPVGYGYQVAKQQLNNYIVWSYRDVVTNTAAMRTNNV